MNLLQTKLEIEIFKDVILPKCCTLIVLRYIEEENDGSDSEERTSASPRRHYKTDQWKLRTDQCKEIFITFYSQKL